MPVSVVVVVAGALPVGAFQLAVVAVSADKTHPAVNPARSNKFTSLVNAVTSVTSDSVCVCADGANVDGLFIKSSQDVNDVVKVPVALLYEARCLPTAPAVDGKTVAIGKYNPA